MKFLALTIMWVHIAWILAVIFGAIWTRGRPFWTTVHLLSLIWGIIVEVGPWPCPMTLAEQWVETHAGMHAFQGSFMLYYLDKIVYPNLPWVLVGTIGVIVCAVNLGIYARRFKVWLHTRHAVA